VDMFQSLRTVVMQQRASPTRSSSSRSSGSRPSSSPTAASRPQRAHGHGRQIAFAAACGPINGCASTDWPQQREIEPFIVVLQRICNASPLRSAPAYAELVVATLMAIQLPLAQAASASLITDRSSCLAAVICCCADDGFALRTCADRLRTVAGHRSGVSPCWQPSSGSWSMHQHEQRRCGLRLLHVHAFQSAVRPRWH